jgi:hypothetical protein
LEKISYFSPAEKVRIMHKSYLKINKINKIYFDKYIFKTSLSDAVAKV